MLAPMRVTLRSSSAESYTYIEPHQHRKHIGCLTHVKDPAALCNLPDPRTVCCAGVELDSVNTFVRHRYLKPSE